MSTGSTLSTKSTLTTAAAAISVSENAGPTAIGIVAPIDSQYSSTQLTITVTALPSDGVILLADGTTSITVGEKLTVAQLVGLEFKPTAGLFGKTSNFTYSVADPSGTVATGTATLTIAPDAMPPKTTAAALSVVGNAAATPIRIAAPTDPNYAASQLSITVTALPSDGTVLLPGGTTAVTLGETLTVAQLTGLVFKPKTTAAGHTSTFSYTVTNPSKLSATGTATLSVTASPDGSALIAGAGGSLVTKAGLWRFSATGDSYGYLILLNGVQAGGGSGTMLEVANQGNLYSENAAGDWYEWVSGGWSAASDPKPAKTTLPLSADGSVLLPGSTGNLVTTAGRWTFSTNTDSYGHLILLNGFSAGGGSGTELEVANQGNLYQKNDVGDWYEWVEGTGWIAAGAPASPSPSQPPKTTAASLTVAENAAATPIGIAAPTDPNYAASQLVATVTALPSDGVVLLAGGSTATVGEKLTVTQLTGLEFEPNSTAAGASSTFAYTVTDPSKLSATGTATLSVTSATPTISPDGSILLPGSTGSLVTSAGQWTFSTTTGPYGYLILLNGVSAGGALGTELEVANQGTLFLQDNLGDWYEWEGSGWTGTSAPTTTTTPPSGTTESPDGSILLPGSGGSLVTTAGTWTFSTTVNSTGNLILLNGVQAGNGAGTELEVANQGNLYADNALGQWYEWVGGAWNASSDPTSTTTSGLSGMGSSNVYTLPAVVQPSNTGDIVGLRLQNPGSTSESSGYVTFGEIFNDGAVKPTDSLVARIGGVDYAVQMDVKTTNADGSVRNAILTLDAPSIAADGSVDVMLAKGSAALPSSSAPSAAALLAGGYNVAVNFTFHNPDGTTTTDSASAASALQNAISAGKVTNFLAGPEVNEFDVTTTVDGGKLKVTFDIRAYADGTTTTDVVFDNGWMFSPGKSDLNYDVAINQGGSQVYSAAGVSQYLYSTWHHQVASGGTVSPNVQYDVAYLEATGAVPTYDPTIGVSADAVAADLSGLNPTNTGPLGTAEVTTYMPETGERPDLGTQPLWTVEALMSQDAGADQVMFADADAAGGVPWHMIDENTGQPITRTDYPTFWNDYRGALVPTNGWPDSNPADTWTPETAHQPDLNYVPYLVSGSAYQLAELKAQAAYVLTSNDPTYSTDVLIDGKYPGGFVLDGNNEVRGEAWDLREVAEAAYLTPDNDPMKSYFVTALNTNMQAMAQQYLVDGIDSKYGAIQGFVGFNQMFSDLPPWQEDYLVTVLGEVAGMNMGQASTQAVQMLNWMNNFVAGLWTNGQNGYNPMNGSAYYLYVSDPSTGTPYTSWAQLYNENVAQGMISANSTTLDGYGTDVVGGYPAIAAAALATEITWTGSPQAMQAYGYVVSQMAKEFGSQDAMTAAYQASPTWTQMPKLPDGSYLTRAQMQIDVSDNNVSLTAAGGASLLSVTGGGTDTLTGGTGTDLMYGGTGSDTFNAGTGNDYMFGGTGQNVFNDNTGSDYYGFAGVGNTLNIGEANSGHDTVFNFNSLTDKINIGANLNGNGITSASQLLSGATVSGGNTVLHLGGANDITLLGIGDPSSLANSLLVK